MNDTMITVVGNVVDSPRFRRLKDSSVTNFRVASTGRRYDRRSEQWVDSTTFYVDVECWNELGSHVSGSVSKGDPVVVLGMISTAEWDSDAGRRSKPQIKATAVGHNLARGMASFTRIRSTSPVAVSAEQPLGAPEDHGAPVDPSDEEYAGELDPLTGELLEPGAGDAPEEFDGILRGRDYEVASEALHSSTTGDLAAEPAHA